MATLETKQEAMRKMLPDVVTQARVIGLEETEVRRIVEQTLSKCRRG